MVGWLALSGLAQVPPPVPATEPSPPASDGSQGEGAGADAGGGPDAGPPDLGPPGAEAPLPRDGFAVLEARLREDFPDRRSVEERGDRLVTSLWEYLATAPDGPDATRARSLLAEILMLLGERPRALALLDEVARFGEGDARRARALYLLGEDRFFQEEYLRRELRSGRVLPGAADYWRPLAERFADSPLAAAVARPLRYFDLLEGAQSLTFEVPAFEATPDLDGKAVEFSSASLRGKVVVLDFWRSSTRGQDEFERSFAVDLAQWAENEAGIRGKFQVLGINLDKDRARFEEARSAWEIPWPQLHDGKGFSTPLAELFAIPRLPHRVVISTEGRLVFIGAEFEPFADAVNSQLLPFTR